MFFEPILYLEKYWIFSIVTKNVSHKTNCNIANYVNKNEYIVETPGGSHMKKEQEITLIVT